MFHVDGQRVQFEDLTTALTAETVIKLVDFLTKTLGPEPEEDVINNKTELDAWKRTLQVPHSNGKGGAASKMVTIPWGQLKKMRARMVDQNNTETLQTLEYPHVEEAEQGAARDKGKWMRYNGGIYWQALLDVYRGAEALTDLRGPTDTGDQLTLQTHAQTETRPESTSTKEAALAIVGTFSRQEDGRAWLQGTVAEQKAKTKLLSTVLNAAPTLGKSELQALLATSGTEADYEAIVQHTELEGLRGAYIALVAVALADMPEAAATDLESAMAFFEKRVNTDTQALMTCVNNVCEKTGTIAFGEPEEGVQDWACVACLAKFKVSLSKTWGTSSQEEIEEKTQGGFRLSVVQQKGRWKSPRCCLCAVQVGEGQEIAGGGHLCVRCLPLAEEYIRSVTDGLVDSLRLSPGVLVQAAIQRNAAVMQQRIKNRLKKCVRCDKTAEACAKAGGLPTFGAGAAFIPSIGEDQMVCFECRKGLLRKTKKKYRGLGKASSPQQWQFIMETAESLKNGESAVTGENVTVHKKTNGVAEAKDAGSSGAITLGGTLKVGTDGVLRTTELSKAEQDQIKALAQAESILIADGFDTQRREVLMHCSGLDKDRQLLIINDKEVQFMLHCRRGERQFGKESDDFLYLYPKGMRGPMREWERSQVESAWLVAREAQDLVNTLSVLEPKSQEIQLAITQAKKRMITSKRRQLGIMRVALGLTTVVAVREGRAVPLVPAAGMWDIDGSSVSLKERRKAQSLNAQKAENAVMTRVAVVMGQRKGRGKNQGSASNGGKGTPTSGDGTASQSQKKRRKKAKKKKANKLAKAPPLKAKHTYKKGQQRKVTFAGQDKRKCFRCDKVGHVIRDCPEVSESDSG